MKYGNNRQEVTINKKDNLISWGFSFLGLATSVYIIYNWIWYISTQKKVYSSWLKKGFVWLLVIFLSYSIFKWLKNLETNNS